ncbi:DUF1343 domain-containing protein [Egibacter rhizosphaerae]|uniref:DUF1343 domain-containing protein n=1 Tax=Egibacter rhizosphaerae TaxID=1670831 RepID=A0A411YKZ6_9ACTN|nr:DUF1343 domain-containing protein [Egibacter rhizosphaerae]
MRASLSVLALGLAGIIALGVAPLSASPPDDTPGHGPPDGVPGPPGDAPGDLELGIEVLLDEELDRLEGQDVGIITNPTGVTRDLDHIVDELVAAEDEGDFEVTALYAPEHGIRGGAEAGDHVDSYIDERTGLEVHSLYGDTQRPTEEMLEDVDTLVFDIQDVGTRFYTYIWTMYYAMDAAGEYGKDFLVLDRPNPLGDETAGPVLDPDLSSFVGLREIPLQHGMTVGELAQLFDGEFIDYDVDVGVVEMNGYDPDNFDEYWDHLEWVLPSPNMPTQDTAFVYPGMGLMESVNYSEGRGTTKPFEFTGAPWLEDVEATELADELDSRDLQGVTFRPQFLTPSFSWYEDEMVGGVQVHVTDPHAFESVRTGIHMLDALFDLHDETVWREQDPDFWGTCDGPDDTCWIDQLSGDREVRWQLDDGVDPDEIVDGWQDDLVEFEDTAEAYRRY